TFRLVKALRALSAPPRAEVAQERGTAGQIFACGSWAFLQLFAGHRQELQRSSFAPAFRPRVLIGLSSSGCVTCWMTSIFSRLGTYIANVLAVLRGPFWER